MEIILNPQEKKLYKDSSDLYGGVSQLEQYAEECLEAALAVRKYIRALKSKNESDIDQKRKELISEVADTTIMSTQARLILNPEGVDNAINFKITRQRDRVDTELSKRFSEPFNPLAHENQK